MSKYSEMADRMKRLNQSNDARLDALNERMDKHESTADKVFRSYEGAIEEKELGMKEMEDNIREMSNAFKDDGGQTESTVTKFPATGEQNSKAS